MSSCGKLPNDIPNLPEQEHVEELIVILFCSILLKLLQLKFCVSQSQVPMNLYCNCIFNCSLSVLWLDAYCGEEEKEEGIELLLIYKVMLNFGLSQVNVKVGSSMEAD